MQEFIDNIKSFGDFVGALISLFVFLITLPFKFLGWARSNEIWFNSLPEWIQSTVAIAFFLILILFLGFLIIGGIYNLIEPIIYTGPRGGKYRINSKGNKSYDVVD